MTTYRIEYPDGTSVTTKSAGPVTHAVVIQSKAGEAWSTWDGYATRIDAANEASYLVGFTRMHLVRVVPVTTA